MAENKILTKQNIRIVFMGTPAFAVPTLQAIVNQGYNVVAVITSPDKPAGRGLKQHSSEVKVAAEALGLNILQPEKLKNPEFIKQLEDLEADLQIVVAFRMLPEVVWNMPPLGTINLHSSLLPNYRGAAPIHWAVINGETITGVTTFRLKHEIDTGDVLLQKTIPIHHDDTTGTLHDRMMVVGAELIIQTIDLMISGNYDPIPQQNIPLQDIKSAPKLYKEIGDIDWAQDVNTIYNLIRGLNPYPTAHTTIDGKNIRIHLAEAEIVSHPYTSGIVLMENKRLKIACENGFILPLEIQLEGKKRVHINDFINGFRVYEGMKAGYSLKVG